MAINISKTQIELLDKYLDGDLSGKERNEVEQKVENDPNWKAGLELLTITRDAVRSRGLLQKVRGLHHEMIQEIKRPPEAGVVKFRPSIWQWTARIAASLLVLALVLGAYQFATVRSETLYQEKFVEYYLPVTRGMENHVAQIDSFYLSKDFTRVTLEFEANRDTQPRSLFLAAMSYAQLEQSEKALALLSDLKETNATQDEPYFAQEIDYYLALTFIKTHRYDRAITIFRKILDDPKHMYYHNVSTSDIWKLRLLDLKN